MEYESPTSFGILVMDNAIVFVHATDTEADADADTRAMTLAPLRYLSKLAKTIFLTLQYLKDAYSAGNFDSKVLLPLNV